MIEVATSFLDIIKGKESETILALEKAKTDYFHIDVMDGKFVENNTYDYMHELTSYIKRISNLPIDIHLMVYDVKNYINDFLCFELNKISFHLEACKNEQEVFECINLIKENNCKVGIAINPNTPIEEVYKYLPYIHSCMVMTVEPGKGGQKLIPEEIDKIRVLKRHIDENQLEVDIEVDGGINLNTCESVKQAGANILVAGIAILMAKDYKQIIDELKK